jgi:multiple sugar transport system ATP-binding protein
MGGVSGYLQVALSKTMALVRLQDVNKTFPGGTVAVRRMNLLAEDREFLVLVGPSGCGKSTVLRMVAGLENPTSGDIHIGSRHVNDVTPKDRNVAMVFQSYALYPHMTVRDNLAFGLKLRKLPREDTRARVDKAASMLGLTSYLDRKPRALSGGQRQRVALGRAIVREPDVFLFDEPLSNLDAALRSQTRTEISNLHRRLQTTMIYVTHDQVEAMTMADRIAVMNEGELMQVAGPMDLYHRPANRFVASFIGSPSMNFFDGSIEDGMFRMPGFSLPLAGRLEKARGFGGPAVLGLRPEHIAIADEPPHGTVPARALAVEPMGNEILMHLELEAGRAIARLGPERVPEPGTSYRMRLLGEHGHLFARDTGLSLLQ